MSDGDQPQFSDLEGSVMNDMLDPTGQYANGKFQTKGF